MRNVWIYRLVTVFAEITLLGGFPCSAAGSASVVKISGICSKGWQIKGIEQAD